VRLTVAKLGFSVAHQFVSASASLCASSRRGLRTARRTVETGVPLGRSLKSTPPTLPISCTWFAVSLSQVTTSSGGVAPYEPVEACGGGARGRRAGVEAALAAVVAGARDRGGATAALMVRLRVVASARIIAPRRAAFMHNATAKGAG